MSFATGESVGQYRIIEQLGQGGMATVFKAYHAALDRYVAIKAMHPAFMEDPNFLARFQREAQVVAKLDHNHIVPVYDFAEHQGRPYLVMKFIEGETLKARLARGPLTVDEILRIVTAVGSALAYAHQQGVLHRDIKPSNVLLTNGDQIYLADFGLARIAEAGQSTLSTDVMLGTPQYISPEQAMGKRDLAATTDIYSFGVVLYEMAVGRVPFSADTPYSIIHDHIYTPLPLPRTINPELSEEVERVLLKALAKEPGDRFEKIENLCAAYTQAMRDDKPVEIPAIMGLEATFLTPVEDVAADISGPEADVLPVLPEVEPGPSAAAVGAAEALVNVEMEQKPKRRLRWWYGIPVLVALCICSLVGMNLANEEGRAGANLPASRATQPVDRPGEPPPESVQVAQQHVRENPEDPFAHLQLAMAFFEAESFEAALKAMQEAQAVGGDQNPDFLLEAGNIFADREMWVFAAGMYLRLFALEEGRLPPDLMEGVEFVIYRAAEEEGARAAFLAGDRVDGVPPPLVDVARARYQLFHGKPQIAQNLLDEVLDTEPGYPPGELLQAELLFHRGEEDPAIEILERLANNEEPPQWVGMMADSYLGEIFE